ncbi:MAG: amidase [Myxococcota bacterium]
MATPRLVGRPVRLLRQALAQSTLARAFWSFASRDFHLHELAALPIDQLAPIDPAPVPVGGRPPHQWIDQELGLPPVTRGRTAGSQWRAFFADGGSPVDVVRKVIAHHHELGPRSPFVVIDEPRAHEAAKASAERWQTGAPRGPLDGLIIPVKDEFHMRGLATLGGTAYRTDLQAEDAWVVQQLTAAGAIVLGKTHCTEWGLNPSGILQHQVGPRNPYDETRAPGGSSTGSGVATGLGLCPSAVGSDGGGSVRIPACLNGVFGIKPTYIRVGRTGDQWGASSVAHIGPIGQTVADCVEQLAVTAGIDPDDPLTRFAPDGHDAEPWRTALGRGLKGCRIGVLREEFRDADAAVVQRVENALLALQSEGAILVDVSLALGSLVNAVGALTIATETAANLREDFADYGRQFGDELAILLRMMQLVPAQDFMTAARARAALRRATADLLTQVDLIAMPTTATPAARYSPNEDRQPILDTGATAAMTRFSFLGNLTGLPAGTVPIGLVDGTPVGLQLLGDAWDEASVFAAMAHAERAGLADLVPRPEGFASFW